MKPRSFTLFAWFLFALVLSFVLVADAAVHVLLPIQAGGTHVLVPMALDNVPVNCPGDPSCPGGINQVPPCAGGGCQACTDRCNPQCPVYDPTLPCLITGTPDNPKDGGD